MLITQFRAMNLSRVPLRNHPAVGQRNSLSDSEYFYEEVTHIHYGLVPHFEMCGITFSSFTPLVLLYLIKEIFLQLYKFKSIYNYN